jgi:alpha-tubulin suppressor-like RCC1 family protein
MRNMVCLVVIAVTAWGLAPLSALAQSVSGGTGHVLLLKPDGTLWVWGQNNTGQLGDGTTTRRDLPQQVSTWTNVTSADAGILHSLAVKSDGRSGPGGTTDTASSVTGRQRSGRHRCR